VNVRFETDGGFMGRGIGWVAIDGERVTASDGFRTFSGNLTHDEEGELQSLLDSVRWDASLGDAYPDQITYTLIEGARSVSWRGESEANEVHEWMWKLRARIGR
jgi:hypothetical protein